jgi:predicted permease
MQKLIFSLSIIFIGLTIGYSIQRLVLAGKIKADKSLTKPRKLLQKITILYLNPIATIGAIWILSFDDMRLMLIPFIGVFAILTGGFTSLILGKVLKYKPKQAGAFFSCGAITNIGSIGALVVFIFLGEEAFALVPLYKLFEAIIYFALWFPIAKSFSPDFQQSDNKGKILKSILDPFVSVSLLSVVVGYLLNISKIPRPAFYSSLNTVVIPLLSLLLIISIGLAMKFGRVKDFIKPAIIISCLKFLFIPFITTGLAYLLGMGNIDNGLPLKVIIILSSMPAGLLALVPPSIYNLDLDLANASWLVTTALLIIIIPLQMFVISLL